MRAYFLKAGGSKTMENRHFANAFPDMPTFMYICCAMIKALSIVGKAERMTIFYELSALWDNMARRSTTRYLVSNLSRNIFFIATGTGKLCWMCMQFDFVTDQRTHSRVCITQESKMTKDLSRYGVFRNKYGLSACNACFKPNRNKNVSDAKFFEDHVLKAHKEPLWMLAGVLGFSPSTAYIKPKN